MTSALNLHTDPAPAQLYRRLSSSSWLRSSLSKKRAESAVWYFNNYQDDSVFDDDDQDLSSIASADTSMSSLASVDTSMTSISGTLPPRWKSPVYESVEAVEGLSVPDGSFSSYFSLPRRLFRSEANLHKSESQAALRSERNKVQLASDWQDEDKLEPGVFGLLEDPGVLRLDFSDYPESVFETQEVEDMLGPRHQDLAHNSKDWIRKSYDELDVDNKRTEIIYNRVREGEQGLLDNTLQLEMIA